MIERLTALFAICMGEKHEALGAPLVDVSFSVEWHSHGQVLQTLTDPAHFKKGMHPTLPRLTPCVLNHLHGEGVSRDASRLHPGHTLGSFEYAHVLSHIIEMGGAGTSAL
jgi:hypothetical protein